MCLQKTWGESASTSVMVLCADRWSRTTIFYSLGAAVLITDIVAAPIGSWLLSKDLWLPYYFSTPIILLAFPIIIVIPETISITKDMQSETSSQQNGCVPPDESRQVCNTMMPFLVILHLTASIRLLHLRYCQVEHTSSSEKASRHLLSAERLRSAW